MKQKFGFDLADLADPELQRLIFAQFHRTLLFQWNEAGMSYMVKQTTEKAGYPADLFTYHSLRSGSYIGFFFFSPKVYHFFWPTLTISFFSWVIQIRISVYCSDDCWN